jgi:membrane-associated phospholipid phosphatase
VCNFTDNGNECRIKCLIFLLSCFVVLFEIKSAESFSTASDSLDTAFSREFYIPPVEYKLNPKDLIVPAGLVVIATIATNTDNFKDILPVNRKNTQDQQTPFDDVFQYAVAPSLFIFDAIGKEKHHPVDQFFVMAMSYGITIIPTQYIKSHYESPRPYGGKDSFPSGHTAIAFVGAHVIYKEFKDSNPWIAYSGYAMGLVVAGSRVAHNKHWVADVMGGAGIAMLSTELAYLVYFPVRNLITNEANKLFGKNIALCPIIYPNTLGLNLAIQF